MDNFLWRLSMALVTKAGPFSMFAEIDRTLSVIDGTLALTGSGFNVLLNEASDPLCFRGDLPVSGRSVGGTVLDVNAMVRRGYYTATVTRLVRSALAAPVGTGFLFAIEPQVIEGMQIQTRDCIEIDGSVTAAGSALLVDFRVAE